MKRSHEFLSKKAQALRKDIITISYAGKGAHISSSLCIADIITVLYWDILRISAKNPSAVKRDRFILSKGHAVASLYVILAQKKFFPSEWLTTYGKNGTALVGHPEFTIPGIELSTGSLGHGLAVGTGMAYGAKYIKNPYRVYVLVSDAECQEGTLWETALFSGHHKLSNLCAIVDYNKLQAFGKTNDIINLEPFKQKWESFGWTAYVVDGHNIKELQKTFYAMKKNNKPSVIICNTIAGKGVSFMENQLRWHYLNLNETLFKQAMQEIEGDK